MVDRGQYLGFAHEAVDHVLVARGADNLENHLGVVAFALCQVDAGHTPFTDFADDAVAGNTQGSGQAAADLRGDKAQRLVERPLGRLGGVGGVGAKRVAHTFRQFEIARRRLPVLANADHLKHLDRLGTPAQENFCIGPAQHTGTGRLDSGTACHNHPAQFLGLALEPRGDVDRVSDHRPFLITRRAHPAHDDLPGVQARADTELGQGADAVFFMHPVAKTMRNNGQAQRRAQSPPGVVGVGFGRLEQHHHAVAKQLGDAPALREDGLAGALEISVEQQGRVGGRKALRIGGEIADIGEQHCGSEYASGPASRIHLFDDLQRAIAREPAGILCLQFVDLECKAALEHVLNLGMAL